MADHVVMITTFPRREQALQLSRALVGLRSAACVQVVGPIVSTYRWQGEVEVEEEWLCLVKTRLDAYDAVAAAIQAAHPYDTPEIVALPVAAASERYLAWLDAAVGEAE